MESEFNSDTQESGCSGLKGGWAYSKETGLKVHASVVRKKDGPFICRACLSDAVHRHCTEKVDHFAHHAKVTPVIGAKESGIHRNCKMTIFKELSTRFSEFKWVCDDVFIPPKPERNIPALKPDIGGRINNKRVAIEIQNSSLTIPQILKRSMAYSFHKISILWIVPLREAIGDEFYRPRLFERYLHSIYFGRVYYWLPEFGPKVQPVHFSIARRMIPYQEWYEDGDFREGGGYEKPYKRIRQPLKAGVISIADHFYHYQRPEHRPWNELKTVPELNILMDKLPIWWDNNEEKELDRFYPDEPDYE